METKYISFLLFAIVISLYSCGGQSKSNNRADEEEIMFNESPAENSQSSSNESSKKAERTPKKTDISTGTYKYRKIKVVSPDGEARSGGDAIYYLTFTDGGDSFYISNHDGSRSKENGGYANRYVPGGTGIANNYANPVDFSYESTDGDYLIYTSQRSIAHNSNPNDIIGYVTDYAKMTKDKHRINVKIGNDAGHSVYYGSIQPFMSFNQGDWVVVLEFVETGPSEDFY